MNIPAVQQILKTAKQAQRHALSEHDSKQVLAAYGIPVVAEAAAQTWEQVRAAAARLGYPVVLKRCGAAILHKSEKGLIAVDLRREDELADAFERLQTREPAADAYFLVQQMARGARELVIGMVRDAQFGPCVMYGLGGILTELLNDVAFRVAPVEAADAFEMMDEIKGRNILDAVRGMPPADREAIARCIVALGEIGLAYDDIAEIDVNPLILQGAQPIAVDALVILQKDVPQNSDADTASV